MSLMTSPSSKTLKSRLSYYPALLMDPMKASHFVLPRQVAMQVLLLIKSLPTYHQMQRAASRSRQQQINTALRPSRSLPKTLEQMVILIQLEIT